jgi:hypothetical protein
MKGVNTMKLPISGFHDVCPFRLFELQNCPFQL